MNSIFHRHRREAAFLGGGTLFILACAIAQHFAQSISIVRFLDNTRWTTESTLACALCWIGYREAVREDRTPRYWFFLGSASYLLGQILWDVQVGIGLNPFPAVSDLFYMGLAPCLIVGFVSILLKGLRPGEQRAVFLDLASIAVMALTLTLALYLPEWEKASVAANIVAILYPVLYLTALGIGLLTVLTRRIRLGFGSVLMILSMIGSAYCWLSWNLRTLRGEELDGTLLGYWFSVATLFAGIGSSQWRTVTSDNPTYARWSVRTQRLFPLILVFAACVAVVVGNYHFQRSIDVIIDVGAVTMVVLAVVRQSLVLYEQDQILQTEQKLLRLEAQLRESQKMEAVGQLAGGVAHDFNNILGAMMLGLSMLEENPALDEATRKEIREVCANADRAAALTRQLLMFGRRSVLDVKQLELNQVVDNLLRMLRRLIGEHIITEFRGAPGLPPIEADRGMMEQIVMNLSVNARDAMSRGGRLTLLTSCVEFTSRDLSLHPERRTGRFVTLAVADTGCGIEPAILQRIFEPFFSTKDVGKGTGLGLATIHGILQQHQGWIEVQSEVDIGSVFTVYLPASVAPGTNQPQKEVLPGSMRRGIETILLVEDEAPTRDAMHRYLTSWGYRVIEATDGRHALAQWNTHREIIDLVFTDMVMPKEISGLELIRHLRREKPWLKAILSSGYSLEMAAHKIPPEEKIVYLPKPFEAKVLGMVLRECLDGK